MKNKIRRVLMEHAAISDASSEEFMGCQCGLTFEVDEDLDAAEEYAESMKAHIEHVAEMIVAMQSLEPSVRDNWVISSSRVDGEVFGSQR